MKIINVYAVNGSIGLMGPYEIYNNIISRPQYWPLYECENGKWLLYTEKGLAEIEKDAAMKLLNDISNQ